MAPRLLIALAILASAWTSSPRAEVQIGFAHPLSGPYALTGSRNRLAAELAVQDLNANGGVLGERIVLVSEDDACGLQQAVEAARHLVEQKVRMVVGHMCSHASLLAAGVYEVADVLMISPGSTHPRLTEEGRANVFRLIGRDDHQGRLAGNFLAERWAGHEIAILHDGSTYGEGLAIQVRRQLRARQVQEELYEIYAPNADDYGDLVHELRRARIQVAYLGGYGPDAGRILRTARDLGVDFQLVGGDGLNMAEFWQRAGPAGAGTIFSNRPDPAGMPAAIAMLARLDARSPQSGAGGITTYAAVQVWAQAVERAGSFALAQVARMLRRGRFDSVLGTVDFDLKGDLKGAHWQWQAWADGTFAPLPRPTQ